MARLSERLSAKRVELAVTPGMHADGMAYICALVRPAPRVGSSATATTVGATILVSGRIT
jgi:hypothetical protein